MKMQQCQVDCNEGLHKTRQHNKYDTNKTNNIVNVVKKQAPRQMECY
uniref:Uncharacterized protein n=1 Tax=Rhizophora mucronata TaxID=61149 RepID=A0A2P2PQS3_RHIMU